MSKDTKTKTGSPGVTFGGTRRGVVRGGTSGSGGGNSAGHHAGHHGGNGARPRTGVGAGTGTSGGTSPAGAPAWASRGHTTAQLIDRWFVALAVLGLPTVWWWWRGHGPAPLPDLATELLHGLLWVMAAALVLVGVVELVGLRYVPRAQQREQVERRLSAAVLALIGSEPPARVRVTEWKGAAPVSVVVTLPRSWDREKAGADRKLRDALAKASGARWAAGEYDDTHLDPRICARATFRLLPELSPEEAARDDAEDRADHLLRKSIPTARAVDILAWDGAQPTRIKVAYRPTPALAFASKQALIEEIVRASFPGRWRGLWDTEADEVVFELRPGLPDYVRRPRSLERPKRPALRYAVDGDGQTIAWPLTGTGPHALIVGPTGGGKTYLLRAIALDALYQGMEVNAADPKRIELMGLRDAPGVRRIATSPQEMAELIVDMHACMEETYRLIEERKLRPADIRRRLFIIDEFFILLMRLNRLHWEETGKKGEHPAIGLVWEMLALARSAGIHLAVGIQRPDAAFLDGPARDNLRHRASLTSLGAEGAKMMWGDTGIGTDLPAKAGRATVTSADGKPVEAQVWAVPDPDAQLAGEWTEEDQDDLAEVFGREWVEQQVRWSRTPAGALPAGRGDIPSRHTPAAAIVEGEVISSTGGTGVDAEFEELLEEAVHLVTRMTYASTAMLQRKLRVSKSTADRLVAELELTSIIGPADSDGAHKVLMTAERVEMLIDQARDEQAPADLTVRGAGHVVAGEATSSADDATSPARKNKRRKSGNKKGNSAGGGDAVDPQARVEPRSVDHVVAGDVVLVDGARWYVLDVGEDCDDDELVRLDVRPVGAKEGEGEEVLVMGCFETVMREVAL